jgi:hypothetical protein
MSVKQQKPDLAAALSEASGSSRRRAAPLRMERAPAVKSKEARQPVSGEGREGATVRQAPSRVGTAPITGHFPKQVRDQLKILAVEQGSTLANLMAEAFNDLFAKYGKPEIAPHQQVEN